MTYGQLARLLQDHGFKREVARGSGVYYARKEYFFALPRARATARVPECFLAPIRFQLDHRGFLPKRLWDRRAAKYKNVTTYR
jgi:hypothetical protein